MSDSPDTVIVETKHWWESWVIWTNVLSALLVIVALPEFISIIPASWIPYIGLISAVINTVLRFRTTEPVGPTHTSLRRV